MTPAKRALATCLLGTAFGLGASALWFPGALLHLAVAFAIGTACVTGACWLLGALDKRDGGSP
jgi:hypothetical protein